MTTEYSKVKSPPKKISTRLENLDEVVGKTMSVISNIVGSTLGPGGRLVILERQEVNLPNVITKDGVTVFKSLGFQDPTAHAIMEAARDAASKTAHDAGDGTTTATILAESIVRHMAAFCKANPHVSPQKAVRTLEAVFKTKLEPLIKKLSMKANKSLLKAVAKISANGDEKLAKAVMECFELVGDDGNVTITELSGDSEYRVEKIEGYPIPRGYDDSCGKFYNEFINDKANQKIWLEKPSFVLYFGMINDIQTLIGVSGMIFEAWQENNYSPNVVLVATGFSESVLAMLASSFGDSSGNAIRMVPMIAPLSPMPNAQKDFLDDLSAVTGATVFDPLNNPLPAPNVQEFDLDHLGNNVRAFEMFRTKATILGQCAEELIVERVEQLKAQAANATSILDKSILEERIGKITGGIARLIVVGSSSGEIREKKDRAEDAVRSVQGAVQHGCLPGGGWTLIKLVEFIRDESNGCVDSDGAVVGILCPALQEPVKRLFSNVGFNKDETVALIAKLVESSKLSTKEALVFDCLEHKEVVAKDSGLLDSTPAVLEALRNSLSIASLLGTLGGCVVYHRDADLERHEAIQNNQFLRDANQPLDETDGRI
jgi:chaperonin GroEL